MKNKDKKPWLIFVMTLSLILILVVSICLWLSPRDGKTGNTEVSIQYIPENISKEEADAAIDCVKDYFSENFKGCKLLKIESTQKSNSENADIFFPDETDRDTALRKAEDGFLDYS